MSMNVFSEKRIYERNFWWMYALAVFILAEGNIKDAEIVKEIFSKCSADMNLFINPFVKKFCETENVLSRYLDEKKNHLGNHISSSIGQWIPNWCVISKLHRNKIYLSCWSRSRIASRVGVGRKCKDHRTASQPALQRLGASFAKIFSNIQVQIKILVQILK